MGRKIGVDLHKNSFRVCYYHNDEKYDFETYHMSVKGLEHFKKGLKKTDELAVESTGNTGHFVRSIEGKVKRIRVINPMQFKVISESVKKTDDEDALKIAKFLSKDMIPEVRMKGKQEGQLSSLIGTRDKFVKLRTALKNKVHNILNANGIVTKTELLTSDKSLDKVLGNKLDEACLFELEIIVSEIRNLNEAIKKIDAQVKERGQKLDGFKGVTSITGIGDMSGTILLNTIGDVKYFRDEKALASYFGIVPRIRSSNETTHMGRITKMGNKIARTALVQSTLIAIRYSPYLRAFYDRLKAKKGSGKAIIATARKLLGIVYNTLKNNWVFEDFNNYKLAPQGAY
jgi:transposase